MRITAISALVAGCLGSSFVSAAPEKDETAARVSYTDTEDRDDPTAKSAWIELASETPAKHGRVFITVDEATGPLARLRLDAHQGRPSVRSVRIVYTDGSQRVVRIGKTLGGKKNPSAFVDLRGARMIEHVVVITDRSSKGSYTLHASPQRAADSVAHR